MRRGMDTNWTGDTGKARGGACRSGQYVGRTVCWVQPLVWMAVLLLWTCGPLAQRIDHFNAAASNLAGQLVQRFPRLQGEVVDVRGNELYLSLGARDQVLEGMRLDVYREGDALTSPTTGEVLGRLEEDLGTVIVTQVAETYAVSVPQDPAAGARVQAGDKVRITAGRLSLALLPVTDKSGQIIPLAELADAVQRGLGASGRFHVVPRARLALWLSERGLTPRDVLAPEVMVDAASALGVAYLAQPVVSGTGDSTIVELRLLAGAQPQAPVTTALAMLPGATSIHQQPVPPVSQPPAVVATPSVPSELPSSESAPTPPAATNGSLTLQGLLGADPIALEKRYVPLARFASELRGFDTADIDGDGQTELVMVSETRVSLYRVREDHLAPVASYSGRWSGTLLSAQLVSLGDERQPAVVVNRYSPSREGMDSFVLILQEGKLVLQQRGLLDILLAVDADGDGVNESVWGQRFDGEDFFRRGQVRLYELRQGRLKRQRKLVLPFGFRATGAALAQLGPPGNRQLVFVDERHNLQVYEGTVRRWRSTAKVGGSYVFAALDMETSSGVVGKSQFDFEAVPAVVDFDGDGFDEVLVPQNQGRLGMVPNLNLYSEGHVVLMRQTPQGFALSPVSPAFDGVVSGVAVLKGRVPGILVAVSKREGVLKQRKQTILYLNRL